MCRVDDESGRQQSIGGEETRDEEEAVDTVDEDSDDSATNSKSDSGTNSESDIDGEECVWSYSGVNFEVYKRRMGI